MVAAAQGRGKTAFVTNYVAQCPSMATLYLSPDSDVMTVAPRMLATLSQKPTRAILTDIDGGNKTPHLETAKALSNVDFVWNKGLTFEEIDEEILAFERKWGHNPDLIVLDNVRDVYPDEFLEGGDTARFEKTCEYFGQIAADTGACCMLLHHVTGENENGDTPPDRKSMQNKIGKGSRLTIMLYAPNEYELGVVINKNSSGPEYGPERPIFLPWDRATQVIG